VGFFAGAAVLHRRALVERAATVTIDRLKVSSTRRRLATDSEVVIIPLFPVLGRLSRPA
jgi:hypothetical protein